MKYDKIIIGAGLYGLYSALFCGRKGQNVLVLEKDSNAFERATYINQARVHMGYHYPRSISTAKKSIKYFEKFYNEFHFSFLTDFTQIYATSTKYSWTNAEEFEKFCKNANIKCDSINPNKYFNKGYCDGAFITEEYTYDAHILRDYLLNEIGKISNITIKFNINIKNIKLENNNYQIYTDLEVFTTDFLLNSTYASVNQILDMLNLEKFKIKYELCEIILCKVDDSLKNVGLTVMDGPFFSLMPFGKTGYHSLTSVSFTPHTTSYDDLPTFECQNRSNGYCSPKCLGNCNKCPAKPNTAWNTMYSLFRKYVKDDFKIEYVKSLFSMKPILKTSEIDDSRPTVVRKFTEKPTFVSVLSGKINTVYDLEEILNDER